MSQPQTESPTETALPCAVCLIPQERVDGAPDIPYGANIFTTTGHYGSTAFDSVFGGEHLELLICTSCIGIMRANSAIYRVLEATEATLEQRNLWRSTEDPCGDNPWNKQRLRNEFAMEDYFEAVTAMTQEWAELIYDACNEASRAGKAFDPASIPAPQTQEPARG
ncbi:hypothetical protein IV500_04735 [Paeniglutamicibacter antarcticus]|uniref:Uncharacterized protein n=1 Tax=Arthrobacter terrae TaxID=2935737 RepID=A0A931CNP5_9MICC|nr:hypothetical protein [Arthrobacter terrae]MBG0738724.1 hypothetical protein [Arthrobacter terrae]